MAPPPSARPYRDFLTPALHQRFTDASLWTILLCYIIAVWMDLEMKLMSFIPFGATGIRAALLFVSSLIIYILRVSQWHVGHRNTLTPWETFSKYTLRKSTVMTLACYGFSAWLYSEVYIWTRADKDRLTFTDRGGREHDWIRLNERPLYLRYMFVSLAVAQSAVHLWFDYDRIDVPAMKPRNDREAPAAAPKIKAWKVLKSKLRPIAITAVLVTGITTFGATLLYFMGFRSFLWDNYYSFARRVVSLRRSSSPFGLPPFAPLFAKVFVEGLLLVLLWQFVNKAFDVYITQAPIREDKTLDNGKPITSDSKDPNGSLLSGLKAKKDTTKAIALWELAIITERYPERRKTIFSELERKTAPTFKQITEICLAEVRLLISRIDIALDPKYRPEDIQSRGQPNPPQSISLVPQIAQPLKEAPIKGPGPKHNTRDEVSAFTSNLAKNFSGPQNTKSAYARQGITKGEQLAAAGAQAVQEKTAGWWHTLIQSPLGYPFRHSLRRSTSLIVTGAPYSRISMLCNAITALTNLTVFSLREDECGRFADLVPDIVRVFTLALKKLNEYIESLTIHWSDYETLGKREDMRMKVEEVECIAECLKMGLEAIMRNFGEYLLGMGMGRGEISEAKKLSSRGEEMASVK